MLTLKIQNITWINEGGYWLNMRHDCQLVHRYYEICVGFEIQLKHVHLP